MPPAVRKRAGDQTGRQAEILAEEHAEELKAREGEIALTNSVVAKSKAEPIDVSGISDDDDTEDMTGDYDNDYLEDEDEDEVSEPAAPVAEVAPAVTHSPGVHVEKAKRTFRVNQLVENMTYGYGNTKTYVPGQKYTDTRDVYEHLDRLGLVWH
jgi:hypothetical protein